MSSVWRIPTVPKREKAHGYHPTQNPLGLVRRAQLASTLEGDLVFGPFCGSRTKAVAAKELNRFFAGVKLKEEFAELAGRRIKVTVRGSVLRKCCARSPSSSNPRLESSIVLANRLYWKRFLN